MTEPGPRSGARRWLAAGGAAVVLALVALPASWSAARPSPACGGSCHTTTHAAGHEGQTCQSCHHLAGGATARLSTLSFLGVKSTSKHGTPTAAACGSCHDARDAHWLKVAATEGHRKHQGVERVDCLSCHGKESHGGQAATSSCTTCHADERLHKQAEHGGASADCASCHNFRARPADVADGGLTLDGCAQCHAPGAPPRPSGAPASVVAPGTLHGGVDCKLCHQPHAALPASRPCKSCHQIQILSGNPNLPAEHLECDKCHVQHRPLEQAGAQCVRCHEQAKAKGPKEGDRSTALRHDECASCHLPHRWAAAPNDCVTCHDKEATSVLTKSPARHQRCTNCHEVHGAPPSGKVCGTCHEGNAKKLGNSPAPADHKKCIGCHKPHAPEVAVPQGCAECHQQEVHQVVSLGPPEHAKEGCPKCHVVHGDPKATTPVCASCHKKQGASTAKVTALPKHQVCSSCHVAHKFSFDPKAPSCVTTCHQAISPTTKPHDGACTKCHAPHAAPNVERAQCLHCHEKIQAKAPSAKAPEHERCASCHKPHTPAKEARAKCTEKCHDTKAKVAQLWPPRSAHRDTCHECHKPHDVSTKGFSACGSCHQKEQTAATGGKHACQQCHAPHQAPASGKGWWNRCATCHEKEAEASKRHEQCANCHKPHKYAPPACTQCHAEAASRAAHQVKEHQQCTKCHDAHAASMPTRQQCLSCHEDRAKHEPQAPVCFGCHLFKQ